MVVYGAGGMSIILSYLFIGVLLLPVFLLIEDLQGETRYKKTRLLKYIAYWPIMFGIISVLGWMELRKYK